MKATLTKVYCLLFLEWFGAGLSHSGLGKEFEYLRHIVPLNSTSDREDVGQIIRH